MPVIIFSPKASEDLDSIKAYFLYIHQFTADSMEFLVDFFTTGCRRFLCSVHIGGK